jgi:hypothetical protein
MNTSAAEHLWKAIEELWNRVDEHCEKVKNSPFKFGACTVNPKHSRVSLPTPSMQLELENQARKHFEPLDVIGFYFRYWTPPKLPIIDGPKESNIDDYQMTCEVPLYDDAWAQTMLARCLVFCPDISELSSVKEWFVPQIEAIRFTPVLHQNIQESIQLNQIKERLSENPLPFFESFVGQYILTDHSLEMSSKDRKKYQQENKWRELYPEVIPIFKKKGVTLRKAYVACRKQAPRVRDNKIKPLLWAFAAHVEGKLVAGSSLPDDLKRSLIIELQQAHKIKKSSKYQATRATVSVSDVECGQFLYLLLLEFGKSPAKKQTLGEIILFIWLCQSAAFSDVKLTIQEILNLSIKDVNLDTYMIEIKDTKIHLNGGYTEILRVWIDSEEIKNQPKLFPSLTYDNLEKQIDKLSRKFWGIEGKLVTRDFLSKVHVVEFARISIDLREQIDMQQLLLKNSPYKIDSRIIEKEILEAVSIHNQTHAAFF